MILLIVLIYGRPSSLTLICILGHATEENIWYDVFRGAFLLRNILVQCM